MTRVLGCGRGGEPAVHEGLRGTCGKACGSVLVFLVGETPETPVRLACALCGHAYDADGLALLVRLERLANDSYRK